MYQDCTATQRGQHYHQRNQSCCYEGWGQWLGGRHHRWTWGKPALKWLYALMLRWHILTRHCYCRMLLYSRRLVSSCWSSIPCRWQLLVREMRLLCFSGSMTLDIQTSRILGKHCCPVDSVRWMQQAQHPRPAPVCTNKANFTVCRYVCDERWYNLTRSIRLRGLGFAGQDNLRQPTWCTLPPDKFRAFAARASQKAPENILLIYKAALKPVSREARLVDVRSSSILSNDAVRIPLPKASSPDPT